MGVPWSPHIRCEAYDCRYFFAEHDHHPLALPEEHRPSNSNCHLTGFLANVLALSHKQPFLHVTYLVVTGARFFPLTLPVVVQGLPRHVVAISCESTAAITHDYSPLSRIFQDLQISYSAPPH